MNLDLYLEEAKFNKQLKKIKKIAKGKRIVLYGAGQLCAKICEKYDLSELNVVGVSDRKYVSNDIGETFCGYNKIPLNKINSVNPDYIFVSALEYENFIESLASSFKSTGINVLPLVRKTLLMKIKPIFEKKEKPSITTQRQLSELIKNRPAFSAQCISFGEKNPDKNFFVVYRSGIGAGFISNLRWIIRHLAKLEGTNFIPVIDTVNFPSVYSESRPVNNTNSWWEYYFEPVSNYSLDEVYQSKNVFLCDDKNPEFISPYNRDANAMENMEKSVYGKYLKFNKMFQEELNNDKRYQKAMEFLKTPTLGFHFRGTDMTYEKKHQTPLSINQAIKHMEECLKKENLTQVFLATDSEEYKKAITKYCQNKGIPILCINETFGGVPEIVSKWNSKEPIKYAHGKDILLDLICLSKCKAILGIKTNVLVCAQYLTENKNMKTYYVNNGLNTPYHLLNKLRWKILKHLPANHLLLKLFGVLDRVDVSVIK